MSKKLNEFVRSNFNVIKAKLESIDKKVDSILASCTPTSTDKPCNTFNNLPWKNFKNDEEAAWIYANQKGAEQLVNRLKNAKGNTVFSGGYRFSLSRDGRFVRRHPIKIRKKVEVNE